MDNERTVTLADFAGFSATAKALELTPQPSPVALHAERVAACRPDADLIAGWFEDEADTDGVMEVRLVGEILRTLDRNGTEAMADALERHDLCCVRFGRDLLVARDIDTLQTRVDNLRDVGREGPASATAAPESIQVSSGDEIEGGA